MITEEAAALKPSLRKLVDDIVELLDELKFEAEDILLLPDTWEFQVLSAVLI